MPLFGKQSKTFIDRGLGDTELTRLRTAAAANDWRKVEAAFQATTDRMRREFLVDGIAADSADLGWVETWVRERPSEQTARLLWGACALNYAWRVRSGLVPKHVSRQQFQGFAEWLGHAEEQLMNAAQMDPSDSAPFASLLWTAVGLHPPLEEAQSRWQLLAARNPRTEHGLWAYLTYLSPRWNGSAELMWGFLRGLLSGEPEGSPRWSMVPACHFEDAVADGMARNTSVRGTGHFDKPEVQRDVMDAYGKYLASPLKQPSAAEMKFREFFAGAFYLMGAREPLRAELAKIGPGIQTLPWGFLGDSIPTYEKAREWAGLR